MSALVFLLCCLASYRLTRFVVADSLIEGWRDRWNGWAYVYDHRGHREYRPTFGNDGRYSHWRTVGRGKIGDLLQCGYCSGFWLSGATLLAARLVGFVHLSLPMMGVAWWGVAGGQALLNALDGFMVHEQKE